MGEEKLGFPVAQVRSLQNEALITSIELIKEDEVLLLTTKEDENEF